MAYAKQNWVDNTSPLNAERMNHMEDGIGENAEAVVRLSKDVAVLGEITEADESKFLRVVGGKAKWMAVPSAEGVSF